MAEQRNTWSVLSAIDVSKKIEKKGKLSYLSWAWAWGVLMQEFPDAVYTFYDNEAHQDGTVTIHCGLTIQGMERRMWLPVMDHKSNAVKNPDSRKISDTKMRCLVKAIAMFGLGHYIYAGEDLPSPESVSASLSDKYKDAISVIKEGIASDDMSAAAEAWFEMTADEKEELWKAPTKGGPFTTSERSIMQSKEFRLSHYGDENE